MSGKGPLGFAPPLSGAKVGSDSRNLDFTVTTELRTRSGAPLSRTSHRVWLPVPIECDDTVCFAALPLVLTVGDQAFDLVVRNLEVDLESREIVLGIPIKPQSLHEKTATDPSGKEWKARDEVYGF